MAVSVSVGDGTVARNNVAAKLLMPALAGAALAVFLGVYSSSHTATGETVFIDDWFSSMIVAKAWLTTFALGLAVVQLVSAGWLYGGIPITKTPPSWLGDFHRLSGILAFVLTLPVAYHCLWSLGWNAGASDTRTLIHSALGCFFYGIFVVKVSYVRLHGLPGWALPLAGGTTFVVLVVLWLTSSLWFFSLEGWGF